MLVNMLSGAVLLALSIGYYLVADAMPSSILDTTVTSAAFPKLIAIAGGFFSLLLIVQSLLTMRALPAIGDEAEEMEDRQPAAELWCQHGRALGLILIIAGFVLAIEIVGYGIAVALLVFTVSLYQRYPLSVTSVGVSILSGVLFWLFFVVMLGVHMPSGMWNPLAHLPFTLPFA